PTAEDMEPLSWEIWQAAKELDCVSAQLAIFRLQGLARATVTWCDRYDAVLTPALAEAPLPIGALSAHPAEPMRDFVRSGRFTPYTAISNVSGSPAVSLPLYEHARPPGGVGVPLGVQLIGRPAGEGPLLALAAQLKAAHPWAARRPALAG
ncbi:MAG TPA: amidase family protein, partial [Solirubrobacteraceae bacterium]|nr:amidase family protein [Solirubrobacteraceae bacterium]